MLQVHIIFFAVILSDFHVINKTDDLCLFGIFAESPNVIR